MIKKPLKFLFKNYEKVSKDLSLDLNLRPQNLTLQYIKAQILVNENQIYPSKNYNLHNTEIIIIIKGTIIKSDQKLREKCKSSKCTIIYLIKPIKSHIKINIKPLIGELFSISVKNSSYIFDIKGIIVNKKSISIDSFDILYNGKVLKDDKTLEHLKNLHLVI